MLQLPQRTLLAAVVLGALSGSTVSAHPLPAEKVRDDQPRSFGVLCESANFLETGSVIDVLIEEIGSDGTTPAVPILRCVSVKSVEPGIRTNGKTERCLVLLSLDGDQTERLLAAGKRGAIRLAPHLPPDFDGFFIIRAGVVFNAQLIGD